MRSLATCFFQFLLQYRARMESLHLADQCFASTDLRIDLANVVVVVRQRSVDLGKRQVRVGLNDFVRSQAHALKLDGDLLDLDPRARNDRLAAASAFFAD